MTLTVGYRWFFCPQATYLSNRICQPLHWYSIDIIGWI